MDEAAELTELRRRAYGPAGGIDAAGLARLNELEAQRRRESVPPEARRDPEREPEPVVVIADAPETAPVPAAQGPESVVADEPESPQVGSVEIESSVARSKRWPWGAAGLVAGIVVGAAAAQMASASGASWHNDALPDAVLAIVHDDRDQQIFSPDAVMYARYYELDIRSWMDTSAGEQICLGFSTLEGGEDAGMWSSCAPTALDPVFDIQVFDDDRSGLMLFTPDTVGDAPVGTHLRFVLDGDVVKVWRIEPEPPGI